MAEVVVETENVGGGELNQDAYKDAGLLVNSAERVGMLFHKFPERVGEGESKAVTRIQKQLLALAKRIQFPPVKRAKAESEGATLPGM